MVAPRPALVRPMKGDGQLVNRDVVRWWTVLSTGCLLAGLLTTVAVAWCCAAFVKPWELGSAVIKQTAMLGPGRNEFVCTTHGFGRTRRDRFRGSMIPHGRGTAFSSASGPMEGESTDFAGWPFPALSCVYYGGVGIGPNQAGLGPPDIDWGIELPWSGTVVSWRALPYRPVWAGLTADTVIFAAFWMVLSLMVVFFRRLFRRQRGLCPRCRYDLRGLQHGRCPECGAR